MRILGFASVLVLALSASGCTPPSVRAETGARPAAAALTGNCSVLPSETQLRTLLIQAARLSDAPLGGRVGGLFDGVRMWAAVVNRNGELCATTTSNPDPSEVWPGSRAIAAAKAYTANAFSVDTLPLSTAELYTFAQPGHSLYGINQSNPFQPQFLAPPGGPGGGAGSITGGIITFGGGVPLYSGGRVIGGLGVSGDTACADHEVAKRVRHLLTLNPPGGPTQDDISYSRVDGPSPFTHPACPNTYRNGAFVGNEAPAVGY